MTLSGCWLSTWDRTPLWQLEDLLIGIEVAAGSRVLDLGAGMGTTSVYLVREYDCEVVSLDLCVPSEERPVVLGAAGVGDHVTAVTGDVRTMALGDGVSDAIISVDAFEYFGTAANRSAHGRVGTPQSHDGLCRLLWRRLLPTARWNLRKEVLTWMSGRLRRGADSAHAPRRQPATAATASSSTSWSG
jgi:SAM-dependent methyltransferase